MVDRERVVRLIDHLREDLRVLQEIRDGQQGGSLVLDAVKYRFITGIEGCARIAHHLCASEGWASPDTNAEAVRTLAVHSVIKPDTSAAIAKAMGFRNILVHQYTDVDDDRVMDYLRHIGDLEQFASEVGAWSLETD